MESGTRTREKRGKAGGKKQFHITYTENQICSFHLPKQGSKQEAREIKSQ